MRITVLILFLSNVHTLWAELHQQEKATLIDPRDLSKVKNITDSRIINGQHASPGQFPYQAAVTFVTDDGTYFCGGALISNQWILTAAHCASKAFSFDVLLGATIMTGGQDGKVTIPVDAYVVHPDWDEDTLHNDIALLHLDHTVPLNKHILPLDLPSEDENVDEDEALIVSGFGATSDDSGISNYLNYVQVHSIAQSTCNSIYGGIWEGQICTIGDPNGATCGGDSGGPLVKEEDDRYISVGIVSFGADAGCSAGYPDGYTRTSYYRTWIKEVSGV